MMRLDRKVPESVEKYDCSITPLTNVIVKDDQHVPFRHLTEKRQPKLGPTLMTTSEFSAKDWIEKLTPTLQTLAKFQVPYLEEYYRQNPSWHTVDEERGGEAAAFPLDDLRDLYSMACRSNVRGVAECYAPLRDALGPARHILRSHPTLERVVSPIIGRDEFWMEILNSGGLTYTTDLIAGLIARAAELSGDRFRTAAAELNGLLGPVPVDGPSPVPGELDAGYDAVLFYGLTFKEPIDITEGMMVLPYKQVRRFVDKRLVDELAPQAAGFHDWQSLGAVVRPFRWRPAFQRAGYLRDRVPRKPGSFFREALVFLDLLAVAHATPVPHLAFMTNHIDRSAGRLLGLADHKGSHRLGRSAQSFDGFDLCPEPVPKALDEAKEAHKNRTSERYARVAKTVSRLSDALVMDGRFSEEDRIVKVAITLEQMYDLPQRKISRELRNRASSYLGVDSASREWIRKSVNEFYSARSSIVHSRSSNVASQTNSDAFDKGFDIARRTLFKMLLEGPPEYWGEATPPKSGLREKAGA